ncbi:MAG: hypothetical protein CSA38_00215 [Flavobacteriales bacterium]|nr:MAG: hypothetical protein CSA38_00215 [Flavobacteriales bacterium]
MKSKLFNYLPLFALYIIHFQLLLSNKIREELRLELGLINVFLSPILMIINTVLLVLLLRSSRYSNKGKFVYLLLNLPIYALFIDGLFAL